MFFRVKTTGSYKYLQLVHNYREQGKPKQKVLATLGRLEEIIAGCGIESMLESLSRFSQDTLLLLTNRSEFAADTKVVGPVLIFERLWKEAGIPGIIRELTKGRKFEFDMERAIFVSVLHRLLNPGSDRNCDAWHKNMMIEGAENLDLQHLYRAMNFLGEPVSDQKNHTKFSPRCIKDQIEELMFARRRNLFSQLSVVFFDTTSLYFEGEGGDDLGQLGHSKDSRPDLKQMIVGVVLDEHGFPICCELWPGNTADITTLLPVVNRLKNRFAIQDFCIVADRGMISKETVEILNENGIFYILGARMRHSSEVKYQVLTRAGRYQEIYPEIDDAGAPSPLKVKEVWVDDHRYIVCLNEKQARKDKADREAILESLREKLTEGPKQLVGNKGYRKYLSAIKDSWKIDERKIIEEQRYDGKWVLQTNTDYITEEVALYYKELWMVEQAFRTSKTTFITRPIFHQNDNQIRGHVFCSFLALVLKKTLFGKLAEKGLDYEWEKIKMDLSELRYIMVQKGEEKVMLRTECKGTCSGVFFASGVAVPPTFQKSTSVSC